MRVAAASLTIETQECPPPLLLQDPFCIVHQDLESHQKVVVAVAPAGLRAD